MSTTGKPKILVVDDDAFVRKPLESILEQGGFEAMTATNGAECLERLEHDRPDLILLDVVMPGADGFEVCRAIKGEARYAEIPVILMSARARGSDQQRGFELGATGFVSKPYRPAELLEQVRSILANQPNGGTHGNQDMCASGRDSVTLQG